MKERLKFWLRVLKNNKAAVLITIWLITLGYVFFLETQSDFIIFGILGLYLFVIKFFKLESKTTFSFCFFILGLLFMGFVFTGTSINTEKAAVFLFFFMAIGIMQELLQKK